MTDRQIFETDVLIDYSRRRPAAVAYMREVIGRPVVSAMTVAELYAGVREGSERAALDRFVVNSVVIDVDEQIAVRAGLILRQYRPSHGVGLADAFIAATAELENATLVTLNRKHYPMLTDVLVPYNKA
jgi:predicted nucleic acid-binding protein